MSSATERAKPAPEEIESAEGAEPSLAAEQGAFGAEGFDDASFDERAVEDRPTGDFVDGYLAGAAMANAAVAGEAPSRFFYSFDWIGDGEEEREQSLHAAFQSDPQRISFDIVQLRDWRAELERMAGKWLARSLPEAAGAIAATEFIELMEAFLGGGPVEAFAITPHPGAGRTEIEPPLGAEHDHLMFETADGRMLLEFSIDG